jgi:hypothetical protein
MDRFDLLPDRSDRLRPDETAVHHFMIMHLHEMTRLVLLPGRHCTT